jgi:hypothetical protein
MQDDKNQMTTYNPQYLLLLVKYELSNENVEQFVGIVEESYKNSIERECTSFVAIDGYLLDREVI